MTRHRKDRPDQIVAVIREYRDEYGYGPSIRDIAERVDLASTSAVHHHLRALAKAGRIEYQPETARSIRVVGDAPDSAESILFAVLMDPGVGSLSAEVQDRIGHYVSGRRRAA